MQKQIKNTPWQGTIARQRVKVLEKNLTIGALVYGSLMLTFWGIYFWRTNGLLSQFAYTGIAIGFLTVIANFSLAIRPKKLDRPLQQLVAESAVLLFFGALSIVLSEVSDLQNPSVFSEIIVIMIAYALFLPIPTRAGIPILFGVALIHPVLSFIVETETNLLLDPGFVTNETQILAGLTVASIVLALHNRLFTLRHHALEKLALHVDQDPLTKAYNRRTLNERLIAECDRCTRYNHTLGVVMLDIDKFKHFNTIHGYKAGDAMLIALVQFIKESVETFTYTKPILSSVLIARYGGEEFFVLLPSLDKEKTHAFAKHMCRKIADSHVLYKNKKLKMTVSVGSLFVNGAMLPQANNVLAVVDAAMYRAKKKGGNRVHNTTLISLTTITPVFFQNNFRSEIQDLFAIPTLLNENYHIIRKDLYVVQLVSVRILALACVFWVLLFSLEDISVYFQMNTHFPLEKLLFGRVIIIIALLISVVLINKKKLRAKHTPFIQVFFLLIGMSAALLSMYYSGGSQSPYLAGAIFVTITWVLAFTASPAFSFSILLTLVLAFYTFFVLTTHCDPFDLILIQNTGVIASAAVVTFGAQLAFSRLRKEEMKTRLALQALACRDPLTNLGNRKAFEDRLKLESDRVALNAPLSLIMLDLDFFKKLNDSLGHIVGDQAIMQVASVVKEELRGVDVVARIGGEEFCIALPHTNQQKAFLVAERLRLAIKERKIANGLWNLTASFGIASAKTKTKALTLLSLADIALREAKKTGRNKTVIYQKNFSS